MSHNESSSIEADSSGAGSGEELFNRADLAQFDADDTMAGKALCKMLSLFFLYTILAMSLVAWWTYSSLAD